MNSLASSLSGRYKWITIALIFPVLAATILLLKFAADALGERDTFAARLGLLLQLLIPLLLSAFVVWIAARFHRTKIGSLLGVSAIVAMYLALCLKSQYDLAECARQYAIMCSEWLGLAYAEWAGMALIDILATLGFAGFLTLRQRS